MDTIEKNRLIAEFMGAKLRQMSGNSSHSKGYWFDEPFKGVHRSATYPPSQLFFHESWDWLMPVVEKIEILGFNVEIGTATDRLITDISSIDGSEIISEGWGKEKIDGVFYAVVGFIEWYKKNR